MYKVILILISIFIISCSSNDKEDIITDQNLYENNLLEDFELYKKANDYITSNQFDLALIELDKLEILFPSSKYASKGMLITAYIHFLDEDYEKTRAIAENYKRYYPGSKDKVYANYLEAMTYYILIKKSEYSQKNSEIAIQKFNFILKAFPNSKYEIDIITKVQIIENTLAEHKLSTAKFYLNKKNINASLVYLKDIYNNFNTSLSMEETLYLLVKIYHLIDEKELAKNYASILAYNFPESKWYKLSYNLINDLDEDLIRDDKWFEKYNPIKIFIKEQKEDDFEIRRID
ncbi:outer membrane protein assembly factor BamD [Alphaproteobacteria bacterium]|nr:outer membrane protein assembly factor BamD [Alphaproteobacteria bacterium]